MSSDLYTQVFASSWASFSHSAAPMMNIDIQLFAHVTGGKSKNYNTGFTGGAPDVTNNQVPRPRNPSCIPQYDSSGAQTAPYCS